MAAEKWPDRESVVFLQDGIRKTFSQFQEEVDNLAAGLLALGLERGHRLGLWGPNTYEWILFQFATAKAGMIMVSLNPAYQSKELEFALRKVQCKAVVCPTQYNGHRFCDILRQICPKHSSTDSGPIMSSRLPDLRMIIVMDSRLPGTLHVDSVVQAAESQHHEQLESLQRVLSPDDPIMIQFTSVVGVCDVRLGQQVCACIKLVEGQKSSSEEIRDFCKGQMSDFKIPHYVVFVESFPRTASGKVQKSALRVEMEMRLGL